MKEHSPAADRNKEPILNVLDPYLPRGAHVLEIASGTGQHAEYFCGKRSDLIWQPTDPDAKALMSIEAYRQDSQLENFLKPVRFDVRNERPKAIEQSYDALVNINMIHISAWEACLKLFELAHQALKADGVMFLYGPFWIPGETEAPSNLEFDRSLKSRNPLWGIRNLDDVKSVAREAGFAFEAIKALPAHNHAVIFRRGK